MPRIIGGIKSFQRSAFSFQLLLLIVCSPVAHPARAHALGYVGGGVGNNPSITVNVPPSVVSSNQQNTGTNVTSIPIPAPSWISNGNALVIAINVEGVTSEAWTPPNGFTQIGSTGAQLSSNSLVQAAFCKIANNESGNYTVSWNNSGNAQGVIYNLSGTGCSPTAIAATTGYASSLTQSVFSTGVNDLVVLFAGQAESIRSTYHVQAVSPGTLTKGPEQSFGTVLAGFTMPNGGGITPTMVVEYTNQTGRSNQTNDAILQAFDFPPYATASNAAVTNGSAANLAALNLNGPLDVNGTARASTFLIPNGVLTTGTANSLAFQTTTGLAVSGMGLNASNNFLIDPTEAAALVSVGNGIHTNGSDLFVVQPSGIEWISQDNAQDLFLFRSDASNNLKFGNANSAGSSEENDMYFQVQTGKTFHWSLNNTDELTFNSFGLNLIGGETISSTGGTAPTLTAGCNGPGSSVAAGSTNNRGQFTTQSAAATGCTLTFNGTWPQAPICVFTDGSGNTTPVTFSAGTTSSTTAIVDFASATSKVVNYVCL